RSVSPRRGERFVVKPRYSAFDHTPLELILEALECQRLLLAGMTTEGCCPKRRSTRGRLVSRSPSSRRRARR
ncbi:MAG: isochorismatase family protein, partial [Actinobacteria bacterium]|nr:isochorismatase family protein [Actinomycetota bacterium]